MPQRLNAVKHIFTTIANFPLASQSFSLHIHGMENLSNRIIDGLGGTTAVAKLLRAPTSTVHSWRKGAIPRSRLAHIEIAALAEGLTLPPEFYSALHSEGAQ